MTASWERIAAALGAGRLSDLELAGQLGCKPCVVARVRHELGQPAFPAPECPAPTRSARMAAEECFEENAVVIAGGHVTWRGRTTIHGVPIVDPFVTAARVAFRAHHGREPEGQVRTTCEVKHCLAGGHLADRVMRELARGDRRALDACL
ncbi:hypothetical protein ACIQMV_19475 [Streptomyces sp. NPDC091412]|uniref:hypothetical protein n=1 Tax=Streptomyces sp. NPDC091412 TaxID=3366002 RepID=UPI00382EB3C7